jgi:hypothetical protein
MVELREYISQLLFHEVQQIETNQSLTPLTLGFFSFSMDDMEVSSFSLAGLLEISLIKM